MPLRRWVLGVGSDAPIVPLGVHVCALMPCAVQMVQDLFSSHVDLFIPCPNASVDRGQYRDVFIPNPK